eukprot:13181845-Heterocapsa_arctica.AAC.1
MPRGRAGRSNHRHALPVRRRCGAGRSEPAATYHSAIAVRGSEGVGRVAQDTGTPGAPTRRTRSMKEPTRTM